MNLQRQLTLIKYRLLINNSFLSRELFSLLAEAIKIIADIKTVIIMNEITKEDSNHFNNILEYEQYNQLVSIINEHSVATLINEIRKLTQKHADEVEEGLIETDTETLSNEVDYESWRDCSIILNALDLPC